MTHTRRYIDEKRNAKKNFRGERAPNEELWKKTHSRNNTTAQTHKKLLSSRSRSCSRYRSLFRTRCLLPSPVIKIHTHSRSLSQQFRVLFFIHLCTARITSFFAFIHSLFILILDFTSFQFKNQIVVYSVVTLLLLLISSILFHTLIHLLLLGLTLFPSRHCIYAVSTCACVFSCYFSAPLVVVAFVIILSLLFSSTFLFVYPFLQMLRMVLFLLLSLSVFQ